MWFWLLPCQVEVIRGVMEDRTRNAPDNHQGNSSAACPLGDWMLCCCWRVGMCPIPSAKAADPQSEKVAPRPDQTDCSIPADNSQSRPSLWI